MDGRSQGRRLANWTDCFQSGPMPKGACATPIDLRKIMRDPQFFGSSQHFWGPYICVAPVAKENQSELRGILTSSFIIIDLVL